MITPTWMKTWEDELQTSEEQGFLGWSIRRSSWRIYSTLRRLEARAKSDFASGYGTGWTRQRGRAGGFKPSPAEEGHTVMMEIRDAAVDPEKRTKAIAANQKHHEKELASRPGAFQSELSGFVGGKKLEMMGGAEEAEEERVGAQGDV